MAGPEFFGWLCAVLAIYGWCLARAAAKEAPKPIIRPEVAQVYQGDWRDWEWMVRMDQEVDECKRRMNADAEIRLANWEAQYEREMDEFCKCNERGQHNNG